jgi:hypothetical protein
MVRRRRTELALGLALALGVAPAVAQTHRDHVRVEPTIPADEDGGAFDNGLVNAAVFAWNEFIALNWPAQPRTRDIAAGERFFGTVPGPLVWETFRSKVEVYPGTAGAAPPHGGLGGYADPPDYIYAAAQVGAPDGRVKPCSGERPQPIAWINLDETSEIGVNQTFAGIVPKHDPSGHNSAPQLIRYAVKTHHVEYLYVVQNQYWYQSPSLSQAVNNYRAAYGSDPPRDPATPFVKLPVGTIEVKTAWRPLAPGEDPRRFHTAVVRYYETAKPPPGNYCFRQQIWGLVGMHIIHKTPSAPWLIWATFEQADNHLTPDRQTVEDAEGNIRVTTPELVYKDDPKTPTVSIVGTQYCAAPGPRPFLREAKQYTGLPTGGDVCVDQRFHPIADVITEVNGEAHQAIDAYTALHAITTSPWRYYKLINVQPQPFDKSQIQYGPGVNLGPSTYYTANGVIETDYSLGVFSGQIAADGAPTDFTSQGQPGFKNVVLLPFQGRSVIPPVNMGGCTGCHSGSAAAYGTDFSFILGQTTSVPETPGVTGFSLLQREHYQKLLLH